MADVVEDVPLAQLVDFIEDDDVLGRGVPESVQASGSLLLTRHHLLSRQWLQQTGQKNNCRVSQTD